jgi:hypothetical protein
MDDQQKAARPTTVTLTPGSIEALDAMVVILKQVGFRVKTAALVEAALVELKEQMEAGKAVEIVRRRVPPHSVVFPP